MLAGTEGAEKLSNEIENRIRTIGRSRSFVDWDKRKGLLQELDHLRTTISGTLIKQDPVLAAERMWEFIGVADSVLERIGDGTLWRTCSARQWSTWGEFAQVCRSGSRTTLPGVFWLILAVQDVATDETKAATLRDLQTTLRHLREMTKHAEHAMHTVVLSGTRARKQMLAASPLSKAGFH